MGFVVNFSRIFEIIIFGSVVAFCDLVHIVETIYDLRKLHLDFFFRNMRDAGETVRTSHEVLFNLPRFQTLMSRPMHN